MKDPFLQYRFSACGLRFSSRKSHINDPQDKPVLISWDKSHQILSRNINISLLSCLQSVTSCHFEFYIQFAFLCLIFYFTDECMQQYANYCKVHRSLFMPFAKEKNQKKVNLIC